MVTKGEVDLPVSDAVAVTSPGPVPVGPALPTVELGNGNAGELDRVEDWMGGPVPKRDDEVKPLVPPLPIGATMLEFGIGYGALVLWMPGAVPVPRGPELRGIPVEAPVPEPRMDDKLVALGNGNGGELNPVARLVGAVTPPVVERPQLLEFNQGNGADVDDAPGAPVKTPVPENVSCPLGTSPVPPVGPDARLELLRGKGGRVVLDSGVETEPVPLTGLVTGFVPVGPNEAVEELLNG